MDLIKCFIISLSRKKLIMLPCGKLTTMAFGKAVIIADDL